MRKPARSKSSSLCSTSSQEPASSTSLGDVFRGGFSYDSYGTLNLMQWWVSNRQAGFTIVELLIVIVVIGILAAITMATFNGIQRQAASSSLKSDLTQAARTMEATYVDHGSYPVILPSSVTVSPGTTLELIAEEGVPQYPALSSVQTGVLFHQLCQELVTEGYGTGTNMGGQIEQYITGCHVYNYNQIQIHGWDSHTFSTPISSVTLPNYATNIPPGGSWRPNQQAVLRAFYTELHNRFLAVGGNYPVSSFWDPWATSGNGGVMTQTLPTPTAPGPDGTTYCIQATHMKHTDLMWHIQKGDKLTSGTC